MKKVLIVLTLLVAIVGFAAAQSVNLGDFPLGTWIDKNYNAQWFFESGNIRIKDNANTPIWNFAEQGIQDYSIKPSTQGIVLTWSCAEAGESGKTYIITYALGSEDLELVIKRAEYPDYFVTLKKQIK